MASPFFFVSKKDGELRPCQDYRYLNDWTVKNFLSTTTYLGNYGQTQRRKVLHQAGRALGLQ
jgi:hypothetical protein